jgi:hypothetical protein
VAQVAIVFGKRPKKIPPHPPCQNKTDPATCATTHKAIASKSEPNHLSNRYYFSERRTQLMIQSYKATISRNNLKRGQYLPEMLTVVRENPVDYDTDRRYYAPAVALLGKMYQELNR